MEAESAEQEELSHDFKQKVGKWEAAGAFDKIAAKVEEVLDKEMA